MSPYGRQWKYPKFTYEEHYVQEKNSKGIQIKIIKEHDERISYWSRAKSTELKVSSVDGDMHMLHLQEAGLENTNSDQCNYSCEFKQMVVTEYLEGKISIRFGYKHKILAPSTTDMIVYIITMKSLTTTVACSPHG